MRGWVQGPAGVSRPLHLDHITKTDVRASWRCWWLTEYSRGARSATPPQAAHPAGHPDRQGPGGAWRRRGEGVPLKVAAPLLPAHRVGAPVGAGRSGGVLPRWAELQQCLAFSGVANERMQARDHGKLLHRSAAGRCSAARQAALRRASTQQGALPQHRGSVAGGAVPTSLHSFTRTGLFHQLVRPLSAPTLSAPIPSPLPARPAPPPQHFRRQAAEARGAAGAAGRAGGAGGEGQAGRGSGARRCCRGSASKGACLPSSPACHPPTPCLPPPCAIPPFRLRWWWGQME